MAVYLTFNIVYSCLSNAGHSFWGKHPGRIEKTLQVSPQPALPIHLPLHSRLLCSPCSCCHCILLCPGIFVYIYNYIYIYIYIYTGWSIFPSCEKCLLRFWLIMSLQGTSRIAIMSKESFRNCFISNSIFRNCNELLFLATLQ